jgi:hypothetical protein
MTTNRKTIRVRISDDGTLFTIALTAGIGCSIAVGTVAYLIYEGMAISFGLALVCLAISTGVMTSIVRRGISTTIELDPDDLQSLIPRQEIPAPRPMVEPEEPEPEAEELDDETPAGPQWFETPYPDPDTDTELKDEEAPKA